MIRTVSCVRKMAVTIIIATVFLSTVLGFLPNQFSLMTLGNDYTHQDITEIGILLAVAEFFEGRPFQGKSFAKGELTGIKDITTRKLFDKYYAGQVSEKRFQEAIDSIVKANNRVDQDHYTDSTWHVNGEAIRAANDKIILLRETAINVLNHTQPNYDAARELIGQFLHIVQMFYSNTNWPEHIGDNSSYDALGIRGQHLMAQAPFAMDTCRNCGPKYGIPCVANLLTKGPLLTSGYKSGQDRIKPNKNPTYETTGKCSHGGPYDKSGTNKAAVGGINKDTSDPGMSPHHLLHERAAQGAIQHTRKLFSNPGTGLRDLLGDATFQELLELTPGTSMVFVIDSTGSMGSDLAAVKKKTQELIRETMGTVNQPYNYIVVTFNDPGNKTDIFVSKNATDVMRHLQSISVHGGGDCPEFSLTGLQAAATVANPNSKVYVFTDATPKDASILNYVTSMVNEKKIVVNFLLTGDCADKKRSHYTGGSSKALFNHVAARTGGFVGSVRDSKKFKDGTKFMQSIRKFVLAPQAQDSIYVDSTVSRLMLLSSGPDFKVYRANETRSFQRLQLTGDGYTEVYIEKADVGLLSIVNTGLIVFEVSVFADTPINFRDNLLRVDNKTGLTMYIEGNPIIGEDVTYSLTVSTDEYVSSLEYVILQDIYGQTILRSHLRRLRKGDNFVGKLKIPKQAFRVMVEGRDFQGNVFQRSQSQMYHPASISLNIQTIKGHLHTVGRVGIKVKVANMGDHSELIKLTSPTLNTTQHFLARESKDIILTVDIDLEDGFSKAFTLVARSVRDPDNSQTVSRIISTAL